MPKKIINIEIAAGVGKAVASPGQAPDRRFMGWRKVRAPQGRTLGNAQRERSLESATESKPPPHSLEV